MEGYSQELTLSTAFMGLKEGKQKPRGAETGSHSRRAHRWWITKCQTPPSTSSVEGWQRRRMHVQCNNARNVGWTGTAGIVVEGGDHEYKNVEHEVRRQSGAVG